jgi:hypothetical protein
MSKIPKIAIFLFTIIPPEIYLLKYTIFSFAPQGGGAFFDFFAFLFRITFRRSPSRRQAAKRKQTCYAQCARTPFFIFIFFRGFIRMCEPYSTFPAGLN